MLIPTDVDPRLQPYKLGDKVVLSSGGPFMRVIELTTMADSQLGQIPAAVCTWTENDGNSSSGEYPAACLARAIGREFRERLL